MKQYESEFECSNCSSSVHPATYRASCPDCGGPLETRPRRYRSRNGR